MKPTATPASISLKKRLKIEENIKAWNCICNAYNCNKLSRDVYLYQITLENGLKCLHKFRYKSFNIGYWSLSCRAQSSDFFKQKLRLFKSPIFSHILGDVKAK